VNTLNQYIRKQISSRVLIPAANIRKQGFSSETLAFSVSIGIIGGAFPVIGGASYVCLFLTLVFKQNILIAQVANWLSYPIQILLLIPFMKFGNLIIVGGDLTITLNQVVVAFQSGLLNGIREIGIFSLYGIIAWAAVALPCMFILYVLFLVIFKNMKRMNPKASLLVISKSKKTKDPILPMDSTII
jgi:uncharacterized protein (DUF2062 family)